jgi:arsenate reductase
LSDVILLHNARCSKSRAALALLESRGIQPRVINYLENPPSEEEIERILDLLGLQPRELMRRNEDEYRELDLDNPTHTRAELIRAMHVHPRLIERPIVLANGKAAIGRPTEAILDVI